MGTTSRAASGILLSHQHAAGSGRTLFDLDPTLLCSLSADALCAYINPALTDLSAQVHLVSSSDCALAVQLAQLAYKQHNTQPHSQGSAASAISNNSNQLQPAINTSKAQRVATPVLQPAPVKRPVQDTIPNKHHPSHNSPSKRQRTITSRDQTSNGSSDRFCSPDASLVSSLVSDSPNLHTQRPHLPNIKTNLKQTKPGDLPVRRTQQSHPVNLPIPLAKPPITFSRQASNGPSLPQNKIPNKKNYSPRTLQNPDRKDHTQGPQMHQSSNAKILLNVTSSDGPKITSVSLTKRQEIARVSDVTPPNLSNSPRRASISQEEEELLVAQVAIVQEQMEKILKSAPQKENKFDSTIQPVLQSLKILEKQQQQVDLYKNQKQSSADPKKNACLDKSGEIQAHIVRAIQEFGCDERSNHNSKSNSAPTDCTARENNTVDNKRNQNFQLARQPFADLSSSKHPTTSTKGGQTLMASATLKEKISSISVPNKPLTEPKPKHNYVSNIHPVCTVQPTLTLQTEEKPQRMMAIKPLNEQCRRVEAPNLPFLCYDVTTSRDVFERFVEEWKHEKRWAWSLYYSAKVLQNRQVNFHLFVWISQL